MVLEELEQANSVALYNYLDLFHESAHLVRTVKVSKASVISRLGTSVGSVNDEHKNVTVFEEFGVLNLVVLITIDERNQLSLVLREREAMGSEHLAEDFGGDFKMSVVVKILEEALSIESVLADDFLELLNDLLHSSALCFSGLSTTVVCQGTGVTEIDVNALFELFFGEDVINGVREIFPAHMLSLFWRLEIFS